MFFRYSTEDAAFLQEVWILCILINDKFIFCSLNHTLRYFPSILKKGISIVLPFIFLPKKLILHSQNFQNFVFGFWHSLVKQVINGSIAFIFLQNRHLDEVLRWIHTNPGFGIEVWRGNSSWR